MMAIDMDLTTGGNERFARIRNAFSAWLGRARDRRALAALDEMTLKDIGLPRHLAEWIGSLHLSPFALLMMLPRSSLCWAASWTASRWLCSRSPCCCPPWKPQGMT